MKWCMKYALAHPDKVLIAKFDLKKPWCVDLVNQEFVHRRTSLLACHWIAYHKDSYSHCTFHRSLEDNTTTFLAMMEMAGKPPEICFICTSTNISGTTCTRCKKNICSACMEKLDKCPFCRNPMEMVYYVAHV